MLKKYSVFFFVSLLALTIAASSMANSSSSGASATGTIPAKMPQQAVTQSAPSASASSDYAALQRHVVDLENTEQSLERTLTWVAGIFSVLALAPIATGLFMFLRTQQDGKQISDLFIKGETTRQNQAAEIHTRFFAESATTIRLVNDTLQLAKDASQRAASSIERRAKIERDSLDMSAQDLLVRPSAGDDRALVSNPEYRAELESLAERINAFDIYRIMSDETITLTPRCLFVAGMSSHLKGHYDDALRQWQRAASDPTAERQLRSQAWYWKGYECNNLARFREARTWFDKAEEYADGPRVFELRRIAIESDFFNVDAHKTSEIVTKIRDLLTEAQAQKTPPEIVNSIKSTVGNILYVHGRELRARDGENSDAAADAFEEARTVFASVSKPNKWSRLGYAQCCLMLGDNETEAKKILATVVRPAAQEEMVNRVEPRTKALARFAELICCLANRDTMDKEITEVHSQLLTAIGNIDNRLTLYSLYQRRNVDKDQFREDVRRVMAEGNGA